jgi:double-stranded uracil-DNA glycosylase
MSILPDILAKNLKLVFCGTAASNKSAQVAAYYAFGQNQFWPSLYKIGLTPRQFKPGEFRDLLALGIGLTDLAKEKHGMDKVLVKSDYALESFTKNILDFQPTFLAFTSKQAASVYFKRGTGQISYGLQTESIGVTRLWVLTSPSSAARSYWDIAVWQALADAVNTLA